MTGVVVEFVDSTEEETLEGLHLRLPRAFYLEFMEAAAKAQVLNVLSNGTQFICETCKAYILPSRTLFWAINKMDIDEDISWALREAITETFYMTDEGVLRHVLFLYDEKGNMEQGCDGYPLILSCDEVVFRFRKKCDCDAVIRNMYQNLQG